MNQATVPFTVVFSYIFLGKRYIAIELLSVLLVMCAAAACVLSGKSPSGGGNDSLGWSIFAACTTSFASIGFLLKETTFRRYAQVSLRTEDPQRPPGPHSAHRTLHCPPRPLPAAPTARRAYRRPNPLRPLPAATLSHGRISTPTTHRSARPCSRERPTRS